MAKRLAKDGIDIRVESGLEKLDVSAKGVTASIKGKNGKTPPSNSAT